MHVQIPRVLSGRLRRASAGLGTSRRFASASSSDYDVVIAGGGIIGASVAYHLLLAEPTLKVCVIERDPTYTAASAVLSAGGVRQQFSLAANIRLSLYGVDFIRAASSMLAVPGQTPPDLQFREQGYLFLASEAGEPTLRRNVATQRSCGVDWTTLLSPSDLRARFPWINTDGLALGCFGEHSEGWFDPWALLHALRSKSRHMGVEFRHGSVVGLGVSTAGGSPAISTVQIQLPAPNTRPSAEEQRQRAGAQVSGPQTEERTIELGAGSVVNAAGAFAAQIVRMGGAHLHDLPVRARKRTMFSVQCGASDAPRPAHDATPLVVDPSGVWFRPDGAANRFLCGMSPPAYRGDPDCSSPAALRDVDHALFDDLIWPALYNRCDAFAALRPTSSWAGFYENNTLDANAIIGRHPQLSNLVLCNGFSGHGLQQAPGAGRAVAELLTTARYSSIDVSCFGFERVQRGEPLYEQNIV